MNECSIYDMSILDSNIDFDTAIDCFILAIHEDCRCLNSIKLIAGKNTISNVIAIEYDGFNCDISSIENVSNIVKVSGRNDSNAFISSIKKIIAQYINKQVVIDISCIRIPDLFSIIKLLQINGHAHDIRFTYSIPYDYEYHLGGFSYREASGDLENYELLGYGGNYNAEADDSFLVVLLGFEGALALKVLEESEYKNLCFINGLPALYQKYKDISVLNNCSVIKGNNNYELLFVPADNPFETCNILERFFGQCSSVCISPLGTKATALGVCLFALLHENTRIVYPISQRYNSHLSHDVVKTLQYIIRLPINASDL